MPSICYNLLLLDGPAADIDAFRRAFVSFDALDCPRLDLNAILPMPEHIPVPAMADRPACRPDEDISWLNWRLRHWGSKWNSTNGRWTVLGGHNVALAFETPWGPPDGAYHALARDSRMRKLTMIVAGQMEPYAEGAWIGEIADGRFTSTAVSKDDKNLVQAFDLANPPRVPEHILQGLDRIQSTLSDAPRRAAVPA